ncbi:hypothetical protein ACFB49_19740 [Sphingomonas sp. DBB INV C78]
MARTCRVTVAQMGRHCRQSGALTTRLGLNRDKLHATLNFLNFGVGTMPLPAAAAAG